MDPSDPPTVIASVSKSMAVDGQTVAMLVTTENPVQVIAEVNWNAALTWLRALIDTYPEKDADDGRSRRCDEQQPSENGKDYGNY